MKKSNKIILLIKFLTVFTVGYGEISSKTNILKYLFLILY